MLVTLLLLALLYKIHAMADGYISSSGGSAGSTAASPLPAWMRWAMLSSADLIFIALVLTLTCTPLSVRLLGDAGIGWHIRTGQQILETHSIPRVDPFSLSMQGKPWFAWEWLYDAIVGQLETTAGLNGVTWLTATVIGAVFSCTFRLLIARGTDLIIAVVLTLLAVSASMIHFLARPHVFSWLLNLAWFWILDSTERNSVFGQSGLRNRWLWALPLLMLVWVNVHGGFLLGFVLIGIFFLAALWTWFRTKENRLEDSLQKIEAGRRAQSLVWVGLASAAASLVNPYGWHLHAHVFSYLSSRFLMDHIDEFQSPNFHGVPQKCFLILLLISVAVVAIRGSRLRVSGTLTLLLAVVTGLYASRNIPVSSILLVTIVGPILPASTLPIQFFQRMARIDAELRGHLWPIVVIILTFFVAANGGRVGSNQLMDVHFDPHRMPVAAVQYLEQNAVPGSILAPDSWGGYLIYSFYPKTRAVLDDRHDLYGAEFFQSYLRMMHLEPGWQEFLGQHHVDVVLLPRNAALTQMLLNTGSWKAIYQDEVSIAFVRDREIF